jgi:hypothetical protein
MNRRKSPCVGKSEVLLYFFFPLGILAFCLTGARRVVALSFFLLAILCAARITI